MKVRIAVLLVLAFMIKPGVAHAQEMTLGDLKIICSDHAQISVAACKFFIYGVSEGLSLGAGAAKDNTHFCIAEGVSTDFMVALVKERMRLDLAHFPEDRKMAAVSFIAAALVSEYPCKAQAPF